MAKSSPIWYWMNRSRSGQPESMAVRGAVIESGTGVNGKLTAHLLDIDKAAQGWMDRMLPQMMKAVGATESPRSNGVGRAGK